MAQAFADGLVAEAFAEACTPSGGNATPPEMRPRRKRVSAPCAEKNELIADAERSMRSAAMDETALMATVAQCSTASKASTVAQGTADRAAPHTVTWADGGRGAGAAAAGGAAAPRVALTQLSIAPPP
eukprot:gene16497-44741_t